MKDMKEALTSARKADITHCRRSIMVYIARACEYGVAKGYDRSNYMRTVSDVPICSDDWKRFRAYLRAAQSHIGAVLDAMEHHQANDPNLTDDWGLLDSAYAPDQDTPPDELFPASRLPHVAHAAASLMMAIEQATLFGLLPSDPGQPWVSDESVAIATHAPATLEFDIPNPLETLDLDDPQEVAMSRQRSEHLRQWRRQHGLDPDTGVKIPEADVTEQGEI